VLPRRNVAAMNLLLAEMATAVAPGTSAVDHQKPRLSCSTWRQ
jgi:hypothetical protein